MAPKVLPWPEVEYRNYRSQGLTMPLILLLTALLTLIGWLGTFFWIELPISLWDTLSLPRWFWLILVISVISWGMGD